MRSRFVKTLSMLAAIFALVVISATPASAETGYYWAKNRTGDYCLDFSGQFGFRVFPCNGDQRYQRLYYQRTDSTDPDVYQIRGNPDSGRPNTCITTDGSGYPVSGNPCTRNSRQQFTIRYAANGWAYFDSVSDRGLCLTKSTPHNGGNVLRTEPCAGKNEQYWVFSQ